MRKALSVLMCGAALLSTSTTSMAFLGNKADKQSPHLVSKAGLSEEILRQYPTLRDVDTSSEFSDGMLNLKSGELRSIPKQFAPARAAAPLCFFGNVVYQNNWDSRYNAYGAYNIQVGHDLISNLIVKGTATTMYSNAGAIRLGDLFYTATWSSSLGGIEVDVRVYDLNTGTRQSYIELSGVGYIATDFARHDETGTVYGVFHNDQGTGYELATVVFHTKAKYTPKKTLIGSVTKMVVALGVTSDKRIYGICDDGILYRFDSETAEATVIGDTGVKVASANGVLPQSGTIDQYNDKFYWACVNADKEAKFYVVDLNDAHVEEIANSPLQDRIYGLSALAHAAEDKAPNSLTDFEVVFNQASLDGTVSFTCPEDCYDGTPLHNDVEWTILANGLELEYGKAAPGQKVSVNIDVVGGQTVFEAYASNSVGKSPYSSIDIWVGEDTPSIKNATFEYINNQAIVTWTPEEKGVHQGWLSNLSYDVVRMPDTVTVASGISANTFTETLTSDIPLANYYYVIYPYNDSLKGEGYSTNRNQIGQSIKPPYFEDFNLKGSIDLYLRGSEWSWRQSSNNGTLYWEESEDPDSSGLVENEWVLTPEIKLQAGSSYDISFNPYGPYGDKFEVWYGEGTNTSNYQLLMPATSAKGSIKSDPHVITLESNKDQNVHIAFRHVGRKEMFIDIDNLSISAPRHDAVPSRIDNFEIIPNPDGKLSATVKFNVSSKTVGGDEIKEPLTVNFYEGNNLIKEIKNLTPGEVCEFVYTASRNDLYEFTLQAISSKGHGEAAKAKAYIGVDIPETPHGKIADKGNHVALEWEPVTKGKRGYYVNPDEIVYDIYQPDANGAISSTPAIEGIKGTSVDLDIDPNSGSQGMLTLLITARNEAGSSDMRYLDQLIIGRPVDLPLTEGFTGDSGLLWLQETSNQMFGVSSSHCSDNDGYSMASGETASLSSGKISIDCTNPVISFDYLVNSGNSIEIYKIASDGSTTLLGLVDEEGIGADGWHRASFNIPHSENEIYCRIRIQFKKNSDGMAFSFIDNISVFNQLSHDLILSASANPSLINIGNSAIIYTSVRNNGIDKSGAYSLGLYVNDKLQESREFDGLDSNSSATYQFNYTATPSDAGDLKLKVAVNYPEDDETSNNEVLLNIKVLEAHVSAPEHLKGEILDNNSVKLEWDEPSEYMSFETTEDFENYSPCAISNLGEWKLVDADGRRTIGLSEGDFPNNGAPMAFMVFNPSYIGVPEGNTEAKPHSGNQYLVSFATILDNPDDHNDDWLISPALSGNAQTISFFAKQMITNFGPEDIEILYSETGREIDDFKLLKELQVSGSSSWSKINVDLPEGALYFAIRVVTAKGHMLLIDDITYEKGSNKIVIAYNIYRNNKKIGKVDSNILTYIDNSPEKENVYNVSAVYVTGEESAYSNDITLQLSGLSEITIDPNAQYEIITIDGIRLTRYGKEIKNLPAGIYIINGKKVMIKK